MRKILFLLFLLSCVSFSQTQTFFHSCPQLATGFAYSGEAWQTQCFLNFSGSTATLTMNSSYNNTSCQKAFPLDFSYFSGNVPPVSVSVFYSGSISGMSGTNRDEPCSCSIGLSGSHTGSLTASGKFSCSNSGNCYGSINGQVSCVASVTNPSSPANPPLPSCQDFFSVPFEACEGGTGLFLSGSQIAIESKVAGFFGDFEFKGMVGSSYISVGEIIGVVMTPSHYQTVDFDTIPLPDGSECVSNTTGLIHTMFVCPLGFNAELDFSSSSSEEESSSSSESSSSDSQSSSSRSGDLCKDFPTLLQCLPSSSSAGLPDICVDFPNLPGCSSPGSSDSSGGDGGDNGGEGGSSGSGGVDCKNLHDCNWARIDVQLVQLGVGVEIRDAVRNLSNGVSDIKNLNYRQVNGIYDVRDALNVMSNSMGTGFSDVVGGLNGVSDSLGNVSGGINGLHRVLDSILGTLKGIGNGEGNGNGNGNGSGNGSGNGIADGIAEGLGKWGSDTTGTGAFNDSLASWGKGGFGGSGSQMGDSLGNGIGARNKIRSTMSAAGVDSARFAFLGNSSACPVLDVTFDAGNGIKNEKKIDLCDIQGTNVGNTLRSLLWLSVLCFSFFMDLNILRSGGRT